MYEFMIKSCRKDCDSQHTNKPTNTSIRSLSGPGPNTDDRGHADCIQKCYENNKPLKHYSSETATETGWYIFSNLNSHHMVEYYLAHKIMHPDETIKRTSDLITPSYLITYTNESDKKANEFDKKLDELPDLKKTYETYETYETGSWFNRLFKKKLINTWKLIYNDETRLFEWQNQTDKKMTRDFLIESPLKIGDNIATESK
jgi:hypothetical protein